MVANKDNKKVKDFLDVFIIKKQLWKKSFEENILVIFLGSFLLNFIDDFAYANY